jgi:hypothetical protein
MTAEPLYLRGALVAYHPKARSFTDNLAYIPFRFNPESISRFFSASRGAQSQSVNGNGQPAAEPRPAGVSPNAINGPFQESFSLRLRFDVHERDEAMPLLPLNLGIAPELAALEMLMDPVDSGILDPSNAGAGWVETPTLVLVWGSRVTPVRLKSLSIDETVYNALLNPVRAEVEASFEVVSRDDAAQGSFVQGIHQAMAIKRYSLARLFQANTVAQGGGILPL